MLRRSSASGAVGQAGGVMLTETITATGRGRELSAALGPWRKQLAVHDPAKVITVLAVTLALGGDCLADVALSRVEPGVYGLAVSDPTVSRTIVALAKDAPGVLKAISAARAVARKRAWTLGGTDAPDAGTDAKTPLIVDLDATLVTSHSDKDGAAPTSRRGDGFHPLCSFIDRGPDGTGEPQALMLRPGNAGSNTAADHIAVIKTALEQLPGHRPGTRAGLSVSIRTDSAGATHAVLNWMGSQRLSYSVGFTLPDHTADLMEHIPEDLSAPAYDAHDEIRDGAWVAELTDLLDLSAWPAGIRVVARKERPTPGAQLRITDFDGHRVTAFATNTRVRCEDRIRVAKDTGLRACPPYDSTQKQIWCAAPAVSRSGYYDWAKVTPSARALRRA